MNLAVIGRQPLPRFGRQVKLSKGACCGRAWPHSNIIGKVGKSSKTKPGARATDVIMIDLTVEQDIFWGPITLPQVKTPVKTKGAKRGFAECGVWIVRFKDQKKPRM